MSNQNLTFKPSPENGRLVLIRGLPGSGKSIMARSLVQDRGFVHVEADMYFVDSHGIYKYQPEQLLAAHEWCLRRVRDLLLTGCLNVVVSNCFTTHKQLEPYLAIANEIGIDTEVRVATGNYGSVHDVPDAAIEEMKSRWED